VAFFDFRFSSTSSAPEASTAASATLGVPTAPATTGEGFGTSIATSSSAEEKRSGTPRTSAASSSPASSDFTSMLAKAATLFRDNPASVRAESSKFRISPTLVPRLQPMPATSDGGRYTTDGHDSSSSSEITIKGPSGTAGVPDGITFSGSGPTGQRRSETSRTVSPETSAAPTAARSEPSSILNPSLSPRESRAGTSKESLAVVTTGAAPRVPATRSARTLAPPSCPPQSATANLPASSTQTTPGSRRLSSRSGATRRTATPVARKRTMPSHSFQAAASASLGLPS
jgi:hypothetical protein